MLYGVVEFGLPETQPEDLRRQLVQMLHTENGDGRFVIRPTMEATAQDVVRNFLASPSDCRQFLFDLGILSFCLRHCSEHICHWPPGVFAQLQQDCSKHA